MPGFAEELAYRGVLLLLFHRAFPATERFLDFWLPAIITTLAFGIEHGLQVNGWSASFNFMSFIFPLLAGFFFVWLREKTGSLLFSIIAHNASNTAGILVGMI